MNDRSFILIGPGNVGLTVASLLQERGFQCEQIVTRTSEGEEEIQRWMGPDVRIVSWDEWQPVSTDFVLVATPDDRLQEIGLQLVVKYQEMGTFSSTFIHFSGLQSSTTFQPLRDLGFGAASLHPLQTIPSVEIGREAILRCVWGVEGDHPDLCNSIIETLEGTPVPLRSENKVAYHLAAVFASNLLVALEAIAMDIATEAGIESEKFLEVFSPLIRQTMENLLSQGPNNAVTGPVRRADNSTIQQHINWLQTSDDRYLVVYRELSQYLTEVLLAENNLSLQEVEKITQTLDETA